MYIILAVLVIGAGILTKSFDDYDTSNYEQDNWREVMEAENEKLLQEYEEFQNNIEENEDALYYDSDLDIVDRNNVYLENDIQPNKYGALQFVAENAGLLSIVSLLTIIIAAGIIANEFRWGTIKLLLIRPISRTKILLSKYLSVLLFAFLTLLFVLILAWISGAILFGIDGVNPHMLIYDFNSDNGYRLASVFNEIISGYGYGLVTLVMMSTFAFMISAVFRNSSLAIGVAIFLMMGGNIIVGIFQDKPFAKYILFANTNLKQYADGDVMIKGMTLGFSITVLIVYYLVFLLLSWGVFTKRDVAGH
jgi:ABC-2 type transport system permease protein